ncbi:MAG: TVP38/TMEM64 family protein [Clostridiales bacterium]|nr:TVP38/TMEM64 family protein [Candidatus Crickella equi]
MNRTTSLFKLLILILLLIALPIVLYSACKDTLFNLEWLEALPQHLSNNPVRSAIALIGLQIMQIIVCFLPGQPIQIAASYLFGTVGGYFISIIGAIIGAIIVFYLAKFLGSNAVRLLFGKDKVENYRSKLNSGKGLLIVLIIYLIPGLPKDLVTYVAGISDMRILPFIIVSTIGRTPPMIGSLLVGSFIATRNYIAIAILAVICLIILALCWIKRGALIRLMDNLEAKDEEREAKHGKAKA